MRQSDFGERGLWSGQYNYSEWKDFRNKCQTHSAVWTPKGMDGLSSRWSSATQQRTRFRILRPILSRFNKLSLDGSQVALRKTRKLTQNYFRVVQRRILRSASSVELWNVVGGEFVPGWNVWI